jgi:hypothetical protein
MHTALALAAAHGADQYGDVEQWAADRLAHSPGALLPAGGAYRDYQGWCTTRRYEPRSMGSFGRAITAAGVHRNRQPYGMAYLHLQFKGADEL